MKQDHWTMEAIATEMNRISGGNYYTATRTIQTDEEGNWIYYISTIKKNPKHTTMIEERKLESQARENIENRRRAASIIGKTGGESKSKKKQQAARENGKKGGRPRKGQ